MQSKKKKSSILLTKNTTTIDCILTMIELWCYVLLLVNYNVLRAFKIVPFYTYTLFEKKIISHIFRSLPTHFFSSSRFFNDDSSCHNKDTFSMHVKIYAANQWAPAMHFSFPSILFELLKSAWSLRSSRCYSI